MEFAIAPASITRGSRPRRRAEIAQASPMGPAPAMRMVPATGSLELPPERDDELRLAAFLERTGEPQRERVAEEADPDVDRVTEFVGGDGGRQRSTGVRIGQQV